MLATVCSAPRWMSGAIRIEDADAHVAALEADRVGDGVAVDRRAGHRRVDQADVDVGQAGLPGHRPLRLAQRVAFDRLDERLQLARADRLVGLLALLADARGKALDELPGDADDDLGRAEAGHLLGLLEGDLAVVDDRGDVGHGARLHVRQPLPLATDATDHATSGLVDLEHERLGELGPDVERGARRELVRPRAPAGSAARRPRSVPVEARPRARRESHRARSGSASRRSPRAWAISGRPPPRPSISGAPV